MISWQAPTAQRLDDAVVGPYLLLSPLPGSRVCWAVAMVRFRIRFRQDDPVALSFLPGAAPQIARMWPANAKLSIVVMSKWEARQSSFRKMSKES